MIDINIKVDEQGKGLMGMSLSEILKDKPVISKKKRKKKKKTSIMKAVESTIPKKSKYTTEII